MGYEITAYRTKINASEYTGMSSRHVIIISMNHFRRSWDLGVIKKGLVLFQNVYVQSGSLGIGWDGMAVALLAVNSAVGIPFAAFLYAVLAIGKTGMVGIPSELLMLSLLCVPVRWSKLYHSERI